MEDIFIFYNVTASIFLQHPPYILLKGSVRQRNNECTDIGSMKLVRFSRLHRTLYGTFILPK